MKISRSNRNIYIGAFVVAILVLSAGFYFMSDNADKAMSEVQPAAGPGGNNQPIPVSVMDVSLEDVTIWKPFSARLDAVEFAEIRPQVSGIVEDILFDDGQMVEAGDALYVIDQRPYKAAVNLAKAELQAMRTQLDLAEKEFERAEGLVEANAISQKVWDARFNARDVAKAAVESAKAALETAQINLDYSTVRAPFSGRVGRVEVKQGNLVEAGFNAPVLTTLVSDEGIYADFEVDERTYLEYVHSARGGEGVQAHIPVQMVLKDGAAQHDGVIYSFDNRLDSRSGTIRARAFFLNMDGALLPGMFAQVKIGSTHGGAKILVPEKAIGTDQDRRYVYRVSDDSKVEYVQVQTGDSVEGRRVVLSGLDVGDRVIVDGVIRLRPGMPVVPQDHSVGAAASDQGAL